MRELVQSVSLPLARCTLRLARVGDDSFRETAVKGTPVGAGIRCDNPRNEEHVPPLHTTQYIYLNGSLPVCARFIELIAVTLRHAGHDTYVAYVINFTLSCFRREREAYKTKLFASERHFPPETAKCNLAKQFQCMRRSHVNRPYKEARGSLGAVFDNNQVLRSGG